MPLRSILTVTVIVCLVGPATAQVPKLGTATQVEFTGRDPKMDGVPGLDVSAYRVKVYEYPIEAGDRFRIEAEAVGGVELELCIFAFKESPQGYVFWDMSKEVKTKADWTIPKALPGKKVKLFIGCADVGKVNVRITKVGMTETAAEPSVAEELKKLRQELETLRKENEELRKQLADLKKKK